MTKVVVCSEVHTEPVIALCVQHVDYCCYAFARLLLEQIVLNLQVLRFSHECRGFRSSGVWCPVRGYAFRWFEASG
jgi:hypothetical protein